MAANSKSVGRPKQHIAIRAARQFKTYSTGETKNSPTTVPNIIFILGMFLIVASGLKSTRFRQIWNDIWTQGAPAKQQTGASQVSANLSATGADLLNQFRVVGLQLLALFSITVIARYVPPLSRIILVIVVGTTILFIINNPQVLQWLNAQEQSAVNFQGTSSTTSSPVSTVAPTAQSPDMGPTAQEALTIQSNLQKLLIAHSGGQA